MNFVSRSVCVLCVWCLVAYVVVWHRSRSNHFQITLTLVIFVFGSLLLSRGVLRIVIVVIVILFAIVSRNEMNCHLLCDSKP